MCEIAQDFKMGLRFQSSAVLALQEASEANADPPIDATMDLMELGTPTQQQPSSLPTATTPNTACNNVKQTFIN
jgi:hypothetical protein